MMSVRQVPVNLLPWRDALYQHRRRQLIVILLLIVAVNIAGFLFSVMGMHNQSQSTDQSRTDIARRHKQLATVIQNGLSDYQDMMNSQQGLHGLMHSYRQHALWVARLQTASAMTQDMQLTTMVLAPQHIYWSGTSGQAQQIGSFLDAHPQLGLLSLQLRAEGLYEFEISQPLEHQHDD